MQDLETKAKEWLFDFRNLSLMILGNRWAAKRFPTVAFVVDIEMATL